MLFEPLFLTSFLIEDQLRRADWHGATALIVTSASSKTAMGLAHVARTKSPGVTRIGLTSAANVRFVEETALYDRVLSYEAIDDLDAGGPVLVVDFAGCASILAAVQARLGLALAYVLKVGITHYDEGKAAAIAGPKPSWFFAPDAAAAVVSADGLEAFQAAVAACWNGFVEDAQTWVSVDEQIGVEALQRAWRDLLAGRAKPDTGYIMRWQADPA